MVAKSGGGEGELGKAIQGSELPFRVSPGHADVQHNDCSQQQHICKLLKKSCLKSNSQNSHHKEEKL